MTPADVATATSTTAVATRRGTVQHLSRTAGRPVCGQRAKKWRPTPLDDPRRLCHVCHAWAGTRTVLAQLRWLVATPAEVHAALEQVTDPAELRLLVFAICSRDDLVHHVVIDPVYGGRRRLTAYVPAARARCAHPTRRTR